MDKFDRENKFDWENYGLYKVLADGTIEVMDKEPEVNLDELEVVRMEKKEPTLDFTPSNFEKVSLIWDWMNKSQRSGNTISFLPATVELYRFVKELVGNERGMTVSFNDSTKELKVKKD